jgi:predicted tellurium resistance membrane protein TerC
MKRILILTTALLLVAPMAMAYQVTGPVLDVTDTKIVVEKGKEKWEIARDANTKVQGELKKGAKVTVEYKMTATSVVVKGEGKAKSKEKDTGKAAGKPAAK